MITQKTAVIIGAGASKDLGLPLGAEIKNQVADIFSGEHDVSDHFLEAFRKTCEIENINLDQHPTLILKHHANRIVESNSIDNYLDQFRDERALLVAGKAAFCYLILDAERKSSLSKKEFGDHSISSASDYFMNDLLNMLARGTTRDDIAEQFGNVTFITFNYDRCIERYIHCWLEFRYGDLANEIFQKVNIIHTYGTAKPYEIPLSAYDFNEEPRFALQNPHIDLVGIHQNLRIFTESADSPTENAIHEAIMFSNNILSLGFGFEQQNMTLLGEHDGGRKVFATVLGFGDAEMEYIRVKILRQFSNGEFGQQLVGGRFKCKRLFEENSHQLSDALGAI